MAVFFSLFYRTKRCQTRILNALGSCLLAGCILSGCSQTHQVKQEFVLGTLCSIHLYSDFWQNRKATETYRKLFSRLREIENTMSANMAGTDIDRINRSDVPVRVHADVIAVLEQALRYAALSDGAFDPSVGPLVKLWGIGSEAPRLPAPPELAAALSLVNWRDVALDKDAGTVFLRRQGMALDLGAIAKGYAADECVRIIQEAGFRGAIIDLGGTIATCGAKEGGKPWLIGVQNPLDTRGAYIGVLAVRDKAVVTSGVYERYAEFDGVRYHHILSTQNGFPVKNGLLSVTIVADRSLDADALSTAVFALGYEQGLSLLEGSGGSAEAIFVFDDMSIRVTDGARDIFTQLP
jgi:thiamine biosynthesis lipoprotein